MSLLRTLHSVARTTSRSRTTLVAVALTVAALVVPAARASAQNLVTNPSFDAYNTTFGLPEPNGYTENNTSGNAGFVAIGVRLVAVTPDGTPVFGNAFAFSGSGPNGATLTQSLPTTPGTTYAISFVASSSLPGEPNDLLTAYFGGTTLFNAAIAGSDYRRRSFTATANSASTDFSFTGYSTGADNAFVLIDDLSVTPLAVTATPEPGSMALLGTGLITLGGIAVRRRRTASA